MTIRLLIISCLIFNTHISNQRANDCKYIYENCLKKISDIRTLDSLSINSNFYKNSELFSVVLPEFILYNNLTNYIENIYMRYARAMNHESFINTSVGPFQMTPKFMLHSIMNCSESLIDDKLILEIRKGDYDILYENINYFSKLENQWKILIYFENIYYRESGGDINFLRRMYHSGENNAYIFTKINCINANYEYWSDYLLNLYRNKINLKIQLIED